MDVNKEVKNDNMRKYLLTDVASCTFTFSDGLKSQVTPPSDSETVLLMFIPQLSKSKQFEDSVLGNYSSAKNAQKLAKLCGYECIKTFTRHFKKHFGQTPYQWMLDRKMEEIRSVVLNSDTSIIDISRKYGFKSVSHLVNTYGKKFGISPQKSRS